MLLLSLLLAACASVGGPPRTGAPRDLAALAPDADRAGRDAVLPPATKPIRIALLLPLSGPAADVGNDLLNAAALALFDAYDPRLALLPFDTGGTADGARLAAGQALEQQPEIVIGPLFSGGVKAVASLFAAENIPLIGLSNDASAAADGVWLMGFMPDQEVERIIAFALSQGHERLAGLIPQSAYGDRVMEGFGASVQAHGGEIVSLMRFEPDADLLSDPIRRLARYDARHAAWQAEVRALEALGDDLSLEILKQLKTGETIGDPGFEAVLIAAGDPLLRSIAPLLPFYEIDPASVKFLGTGLWDEPQLAREPPLQGAWFPAPDPTLPRRFMARFEDAYGHTPPRIATLGYDAMALVALLARNPVSSERFNRAAFRDPAGYAGLDGPFRFRGSGIAERRLAIIEIGRGGFTVIDPAPRGFATPVAESGVRPAAPRSAR